MEMWLALLQATLSARSRHSQGRISNNAEQSARLGPEAAEYVQEEQ
jgi:hypothetical protein